MLYTGVPYAGTPKNVLDKIFDAVDLKSGQIVYDLGCGDGRVLFAAEKRGARCIGFELSPAAYLRARVLKIFHRSRAKIKLKNFFSAKLKDADVVFCFLVGKVMKRVERRLDSQLKPGAKVICYGFDLPGWNAVKTILPDPKKDRTQSPVFIYEKR